MIADILIVADQSDLNVYKITSKDDMKNSTGAGCCGTGSEEKSSCYSGDDAVGEDGKWSNVDFNEWAGKHSFVKKRGASEAYIRVRLIQDIRYQAVRREYLCRLDDVVKFIRILLSPIQILFYLYVRLKSFVVLFPSTFFKKQYAIS